MLTENRATYQETVSMLDTVIARVRAIRSKTAITETPDGILIVGKIPHDCGYSIKQFTPESEGSVFEISFDNGDKTAVLLKVSTLQGERHEDFDFVKVVDEAFNNFLLEVIDELMLKVE